MKKKLFLFLWLAGAYSTAAHAYEAEKQPADEVQLGAYPVSQSELADMPDAPPQEDTPLFSQMMDFMARSGQSIVRGVEDIHLPSLTQSNVPETSPPATEEKPAAQEKPESKPLLNRVADYFGLGE